MLPLERADGVTCIGSLQELLRNLKYTLWEKIQNFGLFKRTK